MKLGERPIRLSFASASLGFALLAFGGFPCPTRATTTKSPAKREAASSQFARAEELRNQLTSKAPDKRTLAEYKKVVAAYQRVYLITPHSAEVPDSLTAAAELNTEMGDHFGRTYYQSAADTYAFLIREYPTSKHAQEALLRLGKLQKDQLGDPIAATKAFQEFQRKYPRSQHKREVQEALAELALLRDAETGALVSKSLPPPAPAAAVPTRTEAATLADGKMATSGGEPGKTVAVPHVQKIRTNATTDSAEVIIDLEDSVLYTSGRIANPERIYLDLHAARLSPALLHGEIHVSGNILTRVRVAQNQAGVVRVVLDVNGVKDYAVSMTKKPMRLIIELYSGTNRPRKDVVESAGQQRNSPSTVQNRDARTVSAPGKNEVEAGKPAVQAENSARTAAAASPSFTSEPMAATEPAPKNTTLTRPATSKPTSKPELVQPLATPQPTRDGQSTLTRTLGLKIGTIVIDAGHGGHDTGTIGPTGLMEKDLCLDVALRLGKIVQQKLPGAEIVYTRSDDTFVPLEDRTRIANEAKADLFISIHANSSPDHGARGVETYYLNLKGSPEAMEVAARENAASDQGVHDLEDLVKKITRTEKIDESKELAQDVQDSLAKRIQRATKPVKNRGVRKAPFVVLIGADMPSILTEISFLSNPSDEQLLKKPEHRQRIAEGVYQGVAAYLQSLNSVTVNGEVRPARTPVVPTVEQTRNQK
jgi:N-acetylmuramoyl-L-alanine amidase